MLGKYDVQYFLCLETGFIQTEQPYWLEEAYTSAISALDVGAVDRCLRSSKIVDHLILSHLDPESVFLDFGGGHGLFTRLMRDLGYEFYRQDKYADNCYARFFDLSDSLVQSNFQAVTAFEVAEHLVDPLSVFQELAALTDTIIFSTELVTQNYHSALDWWYFAPETGQHISFYTVPALGQVAKTLGMNLHSNGSNLHIFTRKHFSSDPFFAPNISFARRVLAKIHRLTAPTVKTRPSLIQRDFEIVKQRLRQRM